MTRSKRRTARNGSADPYVVHVGIIVLGWLLGAVGILRMTAR